MKKIRPIHGAALLILAAVVGALVAAGKLAIVAYTVRIIP